MKIKCEEDFAISRKITNEFQDIIFWEYVFVYVINLVYTFNILVPLPEKSAGSGELSNYVFDYNPPG